LRVVARVRSVVWAVLSGESAVSIKMVMASPLIISVLWVMGMAFFLVSF